MNITSCQAAVGEAFPAGVSRLEYASSVDGLADWAMLWPPDRGNDWMVVIHGHGSHGDQLYTRPDIRRDWLGPVRQHGLGILTPNLRDNSWMSPACAADLHELLQHVRQTYGAKRFIFGSGSMGGASNILYAALQPQDVSGAVALGFVADLGAYHAWCRVKGGFSHQIADAIEAAYGGAPDLSPQAYQAHNAMDHVSRLTMPLYLAHGEADSLMPVAEARRLAAALNASPNVAFQEIPGGGHDSPLPLMPAGLKWVLDRLK